MKLLLFVPDTDWFSDDKSSISILFGLFHLNDPQKIYADGVDLFSTNFFLCAIYFYYSPFRESIYCWIRLSSGSEEITTFESFLNRVIFASNSNLVCKILLLSHLLRCTRTESRLANGYNFFQRISLHHWMGSFKNSVSVGFVRSTW